MLALEFVLGGDRPDPDSAFAALPGQYGWSADGRARTVRKTLLDTFDWRLHRAGLRLEQLSGAGGGEIILAGPNGQRTAAPLSTVRWPAPASVLTPGGLQDRLAAVTGIRALLPVARTVSTIRDLRVLNGDGKTVAWLTVDQTAVIRPARAQLPTRITLTPVRGYRAQAQQVAQALAAVPGARPADADILTAVLAPAGQRPGCYTGKIGVQLTPDQPARLALAAVLLRLADMLAVNVDGAVRDLDSEFLHDLRISVRRTRSALKLAGDVLPGSLPRRYRPEFKWLGDLTTPTRDLDVYLLGFPAMAAGLIAATPAELEPLRGYLAKQRAAEQRRLAAGLRSARFAGLVTGWQAALTGVHAPARGPAVAPFAAARITRSHRTVLTRGAAITAGSPPEALHDLRKRCKELRYLLEFFASLYDEATYRRTLSDLKDLQDCLGDFQDRQVQQAELRAFAGIMKPAVPAATLLAMGELAAQLAARERQAREEFAERFARFAAPRAQRRLRALLATATA